MRCGFDTRGPAVVHDDWIAMMGGPGGGPRHFRGPGGGPRRGPGRGRARRGDIRAAVLLLLAEQPMNGYALMQELEQRTDGLWRPSPGAVYPALNQLEDEGLIGETTVDGKRAFELTDAGTAHVEEHRAKLGTPWEQVGAGIPTETRELMVAAERMSMAIRDIARSGSPEQTGQARTIVDEAARRIYRLLAGDEPDPS